MTKALRVIDGGEVSAVRSQALWYGMTADIHPSSPSVLTLVTPAEPYVCVGLHQDIGREVDEEYCRRHGIGVLRRRLGGGAVYLDRDQLIFHLIMPRESAPTRAALLYPMLIEPVLRSYREFGIAAVYRPVNDIQVDGRKIGGTAAAIFERATVLGGMFMFDFDSAAMARCLKVPSEKFRDKLYGSFADYITSMRRLLPAVPSRAMVKEALLRHVGDCFDVRPVPSAPSNREVAVVEDECALMTDPEWLRRSGRRLVPDGVKIAADLHLTEGAYKAPGGLIRVHLLERDARILDLDITGDFTCIPDDGLAALIDLLRDCDLTQPNLEGIIGNAIKRLGLDLPGVSPADLAIAVQACWHREPNEARRR